jgi:chromosome segregation ATPase
MSQTTEILEFIQTLVLKIHHLEAELNAANEFIEISSEGAKSFQVSFNELVEQQLFDSSKVKELRDLNAKLERKVKRQNRIIEDLKATELHLRWMSEESEKQLEELRKMLKNHGIGLPTWLLT